MLPIPSQAAVFALIGCVGLLLLGVLASAPMPAMLAGGGLLALCCAMALTTPIGARLRRERVELAWWLAHGQPGQLGAGAIAGASFEVRCYIQNHSPVAITLADLLPVVPHGVRVHSGRGAVLVVPARRRAELSFRMTAAAAGRVVLQGLAVTVPGPFELFSAPLYFPSPLVVKVMPRAAALGVRPPEQVGGQAVERAGLSALRRRGSGTELYEIREHRPGDPFKAIAWKASARAGKLLVREVEREVQDTLYIVLDVSGTMRGGAPGERKLDHCIELAARLAAQALERGDRVGLLTVDGRVLAHVPDGEGLRHMWRIYEALLDATEVVDADLTEIDDDGVVDLVGRYLQRQEGLNLRVGNAFSLTEMAAHARRALQSSQARALPVASSEDHALLRQFCRVRGVALPYRAETRGFAKGTGLARALQRAAGDTRAPRTLVAISDLEGVIELDPLLSTLRLLIARNHRPTFVLPDAERLASAPESALQRDLLRVYGLQDQRRLRDVRATLGRLGVSVLTYGGREGSSAVLRRAQDLRPVA